LDIYSSLMHPGGISQEQVKLTLSAFLMQLTHLVIRDGLERNTDPASLPGTAWTGLAEITVPWPERYDGTLEFLKIWKQCSFVFVFCSS